MNRYFVNRRIKIHGETYISKINDTLHPFHANLNDQTLWVTETELAIGTLVAPLSRVSKEYIVESRTDRRIYEEYQLLRVNCRAQVGRFNATGTRDAFGRAVQPAATAIYADVPLHLHQAADSANQNSPDRAATRVTYTFSYPSDFDIRKADRFIIGDQTLTVTAVLITPDGLPTLEAQQDA